MPVSENYQKLRQEVNSLLQKNGREKDAITIVAVSKKHPIQAIYEGLQAGIQNFGENRVQEAVKKIEAIPEKINWHFIGTLQKNKIKYIVNSFCLIHSIDSLSLARALNKEAGKRNTSFQVLMQVNISSEEQKHGFAINEAIQSAQELVKMEYLSLRGVMGMAPKVEKPEQTRPYFKELKKISDEILQRGINAPEISMGMSHDYRVAVEEGSTILRIGTAIFGPRKNY